MSIFPYFQWLLEQEPKTEFPNYITWVIGSRFYSGIPLWVGGWIL